MENPSTLYLAACGLMLAYTLFIIILPLFSERKQYIKNQAWVGLKKQWFAQFRAGIGAVLNTRTLVLEGYEKFGKNSRPFILPQLGRDPFLILPADKIHEFLSAGDARIDNHTVGSESIAAKWTLGKLFQDGSHFDVVRRQLTRRLPLLTTDVYAELVLAMQQQWPVTTGEWRTVKAYPTCMKIVSRAANRVFSGKDLCRNPEYLEHSMLYAQSVFRSGALLKMVPQLLKDPVAWYLMREVRRHQDICLKISLPVVKDRLERMAKEGNDYQPANDVLQWVIDDALLAEKSYRRNPDWICRFLLMLNMVAIHTTSMVTANTLLDLYSSPHRAEIVAGLREEVERVLRTSGGEWSKDAVNSMIRIDSVIRETMRVQGLGDLGIPRIVSDPKGVNLSGGIHIPQGVRVAVPSYAIHHDESFYPNANEWEAFRFSRPQEEYLGRQQKEQQQQDTSDHLKKLLGFKNRGLIVTTDDFFSFGFGTHACPGRFFASQEMKLMLAHIVLHYDIEIDGGRPKNVNINGSSVPTGDAEMRIRRRQV